MCMSIFLCETKIFLYIVLIYLTHCLVLPAKAVYLSAAAVVNNPGLTKPCTQICCCDVTEWHAGKLRPQSWPWERRKRYYTLVVGALYSFGYLLEMLQSTTFDQEIPKYWTLCRANIWTLLIFRNSRT